MKSRILALSAAAVLALPVLAACDSDFDAKKCKSNAAVQVFTKPGGGSGGGKGGGGAKGGSRGGSKSKTGKKPAGGGGGVPVTNPTTKCKDKSK